MLKCLPCWIFTLFIVGVLAYEIMLWGECREMNSWFYCVRVLGGSQ